MGGKDRRKELEAECLHLQFRWEEELFSPHPDWERLEQWNGELKSWEELLAMMEWDELR